nr:MAG TPA: hypothetical protein [Caudoviricetes sp.]
MAIDSKQLLVAIKSYARGNAIPLDSSEVYDTLAAAKEYASSATAYAGQTIKALVDGKYKSYVLQPSEAGYTLEEVGAVQQSDLKQYVQVVNELPKTGQEQGVIYIVGTVGQIWTGTAWKIVFKEVSSQVDQLSDKVTTIENTLKEKAPIASPAFTGKVTVNGDEVAAKSYVDGLINGLVSSAPGVVDSKNPLPATGYKAGQTFRVAEAGTYAGNKCEVGDLIIVTKSYAYGASDADFMVVQANIDGAVTSTAETSTVGEIVVFNSASGKIIGKSDINISSLKDVISKAHTHKNSDILDSFTKNQTQILADAATAAQGKVDALAKVVEGKADKGTTLEDYGITDAYTTAAIDAKIETLTKNLNTKVDSATVDKKVETATETITAAYTKALSDKVGAIPEGTDIKTYVDDAIGSGGTSSAEAIAKAKSEAISASKTYTDEAIAKAHTVTEF